MRIDKRNIRSLLWGRKIIRTKGIKKRLQHLGGVVFLIVLVLGVYSCEDTVTGGGGGNDIVFPDTGIVSYSHHVQPLFNLKCTTSGCHGADTYSTRGWDLTEYGHFNLGYDIMIAGDTVNSKLIRSVKGLPPSPRMPLDGNPLPDNQIRGLTRWVLQGARQDT